MKDFIKWLGVNEKIAKVAVWMLIFMVCLIVINAYLESIGLPYYAITYDNIINIDMSKLGSIFSSCLVCILNFYAITLLVFRIKEAKLILKYAVSYMVLNWIIYEMFGYAIGQIFIIGYIIMFCYFYSNKNKKYVLYGMLSTGINIIVQGIAYQYKLRLIDFLELNRITQAVLSIDYFVIMAVIIVVKEIYLKKRGVKNG